MDNQKRTYYYDLSIEEMEKIKKSGSRKTLALHACCAPCSCYPLEFLNECFDITILYDNPNIYPESEYLKRINELKKLLLIINENNSNPIKLVEFNYNNEDYEKVFNPYKDEAEGGSRCFKCYEYRMKECYKYASEHNFDYFTTVMTISRQKNAKVLNEIGLKLSKIYPNTKYLFSEFKKKGGYDKYCELKKQYNLYNQQYCGCKSSYDKYLEKLERKKQD